MARFEVGSGADVAKWVAVGVTETPAFRIAADNQRCLLPAGCYYEWQKLDEAGGQKQPYHQGDSIRNNVSVPRPGNRPTLAA